MNEGRLLQVASPAQIYREPADGFVARFIGAAAVLSGVTEEGAVRVGGLVFPAEGAKQHVGGKPVDLFLRPEHVRLEQMNGHVPDGAIGADVGDTTFFGSLTRIKLKLHGMTDGPGLWADLASEHAEQFVAGSRVLARWDPSSPRVILRN